MEINLFHNLIGKDYDEAYSSLDQRDKYILEVLCLMSLAQFGRREDEISISQEVVIDSDTNKFSARYIIDAPISFHKKKM